MPEKMTMHPRTTMVVKKQLGGSDDEEELQEEEEEAAADENGNDNDGARGDDGRGNPVQHQQQQQQQPPQQQNPQPVLHCSQSFWDDVRANRALLRPVPAGTRVRLSNHLYRQEEITLELAVERWEKEEWELRQQQQQQNRNSSIFTMDSNNNNCSIRKLPPQQKFRPPPLKTAQQMVAERLIDELLLALDPRGDPHLEDITDFGSYFINGEGGTGEITAAARAVTRLNHCFTVDQLPWTTFVSRAMLAALRTRARVHRHKLRDLRQPPTHATENFLRLGNAYYYHRNRLLPLVMEILEATAVRRWRDYLAKRSTGAVALLFARCVARLVTSLLDAAPNVDGRGRGCLNFNDQAKFFSARMADADIPHTSCWLSPVFDQWADEAAAVEVLRVNQRNKHWNARWQRQQQQLRQTEAAATAAAAAATANGHNNNSNNNNNSGGARADQNGHQQVTAAAAAPATATKSPMIIYLGEAKNGNRRAGGGGGGAGAEAPAVAAAVAAPCTPPYSNESEDSLQDGALLMAEEGIPSTGRGRTAAATASKVKKTAGAFAGVQQQQPTPPESPRSDVGLVKVNGGGQAVAAAVAIATSNNLVNRGSSSASIINNNDINSHHHHHQLIFNIITTSTSMSVSPPPLAYLEEKNRKVRCPQCGAQFENYLHLAPHQHGHHRKTRWQRQQQQLRLKRQTEAAAAAIANGHNNNNNNNSGGAKADQNGHQQVTAAAAAPATATKSPMIIYLGEAKNGNRRAGGGGGGEPEETRYPFLDPEHLRQVGGLARGIGACSRTTQKPVVITSAGQEVEAAAATAAKKKKDEDEEALWAEVSVNGDGGLYFPKTTTKRRRLG